MDGHPVQATPKSRLGRMLKAIRAQKGWSLAEVAQRTGIAVSTLSKIENALLSPTYDKLIQLSEGLGIDIAQLFQEEGAPLPAAVAGAVTARRSLAPLGTGLDVETPNYHYRYLCTDLLNKAMVPILITIRARSLVQFTALSRHAGEEFLYVLDGIVMVHSEHYAPARLRRGEALYLDSTMGHAFLAAGEGDALVLNVCHSPTAGQFKELVSMARALQAPAAMDEAGSEG